MRPRRHLPSGSSCTLISADHVFELCLNSIKHLNLLSLRNHISVKEVWPILLLRWEIFFLCCLVNKNYWRHIILRHRKHISGNGMSCYGEKTELQFESFLTPACFFCSEQIVNLAQLNVRFQPGALLRLLGLVASLSSPNIAAADWRIWDFCTVGKAAVQICLARPFRRVSGERRSAPEGKRKSPQRVGALCICWVGLCVVVHLPVTPSTSRLCVWAQPPPLADTLLEIKALCWPVGLSSGFTRTDAAYVRGSEPNTSTKGRKKNSVRRKNRRKKPVSSFMGWGCFWQRPNQWKRSKGRREPIKIKQTEKPFSFYLNNNPYFEIPNVLFEHVRTIKIGKKQRERETRKLN